MSKNTFSIIAFSAAMAFVGAHSYLEIERNGGVGIDGKNRRAALAAAEAANVADIPVQIVETSQQETADVNVTIESTSESPIPPPVVTVDQDDLLIDMDASPAPDQEDTASLNETLPDESLSLEEAKEALNEIAPFDPESPPNTGADIESNSSTSALPSGTWAKGSTIITGGWAFIMQGDDLYLSFDKEFNIGTDGAMLVLLSAKPFSDLSDENATDGALALGVITKQSGVQNFPVPDALDLNAFKSLVIYDDETNVLLGGAAL